MSEFGLNYNNQPSAGGNVEWFNNAGYQAQSSYAYPSAPQTSHPAYGGIEDEPPLLEELGIDLSAIIRRTRAILLHRLNANILLDLDMGGALLCVFVMGGLHLLMGKLHFGILLGWSVVFSVVVWWLMGQMVGMDSPESKALDLYSTCCLLGYCQIPIVVYSGLSLLIPKGPAHPVLAVLATIWAGVTAAKIICKKCPSLEEVQTLVIYPCLLVYGAFAMLTLYS